MVFWSLVFVSVGYGANAVVTSGTMEWSTGSTFNTILIALVGYFAREEFKGITTKADENKQVAIKLGDNLGKKIDDINVCNTNIIDRLSKIEGKIEVSKLF
jgi:hypothetical protein